MSNSAVIPSGIYSDHGWVLHGDGEQSREDSLHRGSLFMEFFEGPTSVVDLLSDAGGETNQDVTSFLGEELGMSCRAEKVSMLFCSEVDGARILEIGHPGLFGSHFPFAVHGEVCLAVEVIPFEGMGSHLLISGIVRYDCSGFEFFDDEAEDIFCVVEGIPTNGFDAEGEGLLGFVKHGNGLMDFAYIGGMGDFPKGEFLLCIGQDVIAVAPEATDLFFEWLREMNADAQPGIWVSLGASGFIEAPGDRAFEVVFSYPCGDSAGVHDQVPCGDDPLLQKHSHQPDAHLLQNVMGCAAEKLRKPLYGGRSLIGV